MLAALGLDTTHEAVYLAMLQHPGWGAEELSAGLALEMNEVHAALDALFDLKLLQESLERPGEFRTVDPAVGLQELLARQHDELIRRQQEAAASYSAVNRVLTSTRSEAVSEPGRFEILTGLDAIQRRLEQLSRDVTHEVLTIMPGGAQSAAALDAARNNDARVLARGATIRTIGLDIIRDDRGTLAYARWLTDSGGEFRTAPTLPPRMIVVDQAAALVPLDPSNTRRGALYLGSHGVVAALIVLFGQIWAIATPLGADRDTGKDGLSSDERDLLTLIAQGHTDESAAVRLHISARTARRMMASIMERLGARSRFEAGLRAAQRGWLLKLCRS